MDNRLHKKRLPKLLAWFFNLFSPRELRAALAVDRLRDYTTMTNFCIRGERGIRLAVADNAREAFNVRRHVGDVLSRDEHGLRFRLADYFPHERSTAGTGA
jgi:hypothetical protein